MVNEDGFRAACLEVDRQITVYGGGNHNMPVSILSISELLTAYEAGKRMISLGGDIVDAPNGR